MATNSSFLIAPRPWAAVLLGHGCILGGTSSDTDNDPDSALHYIIPSTDDFLEIRPSIQCQQHWPLATTATGKAVKESDSMVFLVLCTGHACYDERIVTEVGYTIFDTHERWYGAKVDKKPTAKVDDTADHHNGTCGNPLHEEKPYDFCYRKSNFIPRHRLPDIIETAFSSASTYGLDPAAFLRGARRQVIFLSWGSHQPEAIQKATWYKETQFAEHWDLREHKILKILCDYRLYPPRLTDAIRAFGVPHTVNGFDISQNCGNKSSFIMRLLWALAFATSDQIRTIKDGVDLEEWGTPSVESVLTRVNRPPGSAPLPTRHIEYIQTARPSRDTYKIFHLQNDKK
ncbi:hypothetical protein HD806DRAFT_518383 [Xylariaceae sp. AK1471]|nr:hypothetical protein HD806DRAFT_518383 [Xylariaceae sp. AK1471]